MRAVVIVAMLGSLAAADPTDKATADQLFAQGRKLLADGKPDEACSKFQESIARNPRAVGTLLNLGLCNERRGKVATAFQLFQEAFDRASEASLPDERDAAQLQIAALRAQVPILAIKFAVPPIDGEKLLIDDVVVPIDRSETPIDPGPHTIVLTAPGRLPYQKPIAIKVGARFALELPALEIPKTKIVRSGSRRTAATISTYGGIALLALATGMAGYAFFDYRAQFPEHCGGDRPDIGGRKSCDAHGADHVQTDHTLGTAASIVAPVGVAALATGLYLRFTMPKERTTVTPTGSADSVGIAIAGSF
jgi:hypothetical protein